MTKIINYERGKTMPDEIKTDQGDSQEPGITQAAVTEPTLKELNDRYLQMEAEHKKALAELEDRKKEISGLNRKISEDEKVIKQKELEKLGEKERAAAELEIARKEREKIENETRELKRQRIVDAALIDAGIPIEFAKRINGQDEAEIQADVKAFKGYIDSLVNALKEKAVAEALAGKAPVSGKVESGKKMTLEEIEKLPSHEERVKALKDNGYRK